MVSLIKRKNKGHNLYYLKYSSRNNPRQKYLGDKILKDIETQKMDFYLKCYREDKGISIEKIHKNYSKYIVDVDKKILKEESHAFKIIHTFSTQKIEGSTMTLAQTRKLLETGLSPKDVLFEDVIEAQQFRKLFDEMSSQDNDITEQLILKWHDTLFQKTDTNNAGNFRRNNVQPYLGKTEYVLWSDVSEEMHGLIKWYNKEKKIMNSVELSARFHLRFELIHPFIDGNGRIGRLLILFILNRNNYPMLNVEPKEKYTYINKLESSYLKKNEMIFVKWFISKYLKVNKKFLK